MTIIARALSHWKEYSDQQMIGKEKTRPTRETITWAKPLDGRTKLNCDAAIVEKGRAGLGFVLRDDRSQVLLAGKIECRIAGSSTLMESLAIRYALSTLKQYDLHADSVESDSKCCIEALNGKLKPDSCCAIICQDIRELAEDAGVQTFDYVRRQCNMVAHYAAKGQDFISIKHTPCHLVEHLKACAMNAIWYTLIAICIGMPCLMSCGYRSKLRAKFGLVESPAQDCIVHCFCDYCALCQEYRELYARDLDPSIGHAGIKAQEHRQRLKQIGMIPPLQQNMRI